MAVVRYVPVNVAGAALASHPIHYLVDTTAELPASGLKLGDTALDKQTNTLYKAGSATTWVPVDTAASGLTARSLFLDASSAIDHSDAGPGSVGTSPNKTTAFSMADAATYAGHWTFQVPSDSAGGTFLIRPLWAPLGAPGTGTVRWQATCKTLVGADTTAAGTTLTWTGIISTKTALVALLEPGQASTGYTPAAGTVVRFTLQRLGADAADNLSTNANVFGVQLDYTSVV